MSLKKCSQYYLDAYGKKRKLKTYNLRLDLTMVVRAENIEIAKDIFIDNLGDNLENINGYSKVKRLIK